MKLKFVISLMLLVTLCSCSSPIEPKNIKQAEDLCKNNGGLYMMDIFMMSNNQISCNNGAKFSVGPGGQVIGSQHKKNDIDPLKMVCNDTKASDDGKIMDENVKRSESELRLYEKNLPKNLYDGEVK